MNEHLHIGIENPKAHRKELLGINIDLINTLQCIEKINKIRAKKTVQINKLKILTKSVSKSMSEFQNALPSAKEPQFLKKGPKMQKLRSKEPDKTFKEVNIDKLELELKKLKEKISAL